MRIIALDTETTGLSPQQGHKVIEIGCIEIIDRELTGRTFHHYINPQRDIHPDAVRIHGLTYDFLQDKPIFADIAQDFLHFIHGATIIAHNASFDCNFLNYELKNIDLFSIENSCKEVIDTLQLARKKYPGKKNSLDALCKRLYVEASHRTLHGALLDAQLLASIYLKMTGGQTALMFETASIELHQGQVNLKTAQDSKEFKIELADLKLHAEFLETELKAHDELKSFLVL